LPPGARSCVRSIPRPTRCSPGSRTRVAKRSESINGPDWGGWSGARTAGERDNSGMTAAVHMVDVYHHILPHFCRDALAAGIAARAAAPLPGVEARRRMRLRDLLSVPPPPSSRSPQRNRLPQDAGRNRRSGPTAQRLRREPRQRPPGAASAYFATRPRGATGGDSDRYACGRPGCPLGTSRALHRSSRLVQLSDRLREDLSSSEDGSLSEDL
jgi:hypothetical protein